VIREISPDEMLQLLSANPAGVIVIGYRYFSHILIYLFSRQVPAVMISDGDAPKAGEWCLLDGTRGELECSGRPLRLPEEEDVIPESFEQSKVGALTGGIVKTIDSEEIVLEASISDSDGALVARECGAASIGLVRSEFLGLPRNTPPERDDYVSLAESIWEAAGTLEISWRLLDIGGEKVLPWMRATTALTDTLGIRGCRAYKLEGVRSIIRAQLQAIASMKNHDRCTFLIPYVSSLEEFLRIRLDLQKDIGSYQPTFGAMLETPSACYMAGEISSHTDLIAIGTNDLVQSFFGASRSCSEVAEYIDPYSPAIVRFLSVVASLQKERSYRICGQFPILPYVIEYFIGLGFRRFSLEPIVLPQIAQRCSRINAQNMRKICDEIKGLDKSIDVLQCLRTAMKSEK